MAQPVQKWSLGQYEWNWKDAHGSEDWRRCSMFPTVIHHELRVLDMIPDEGIEFNERKIQWVGQKDWSFKTTFPTPDGVSKYPHVELVFDGLDTIATVKLNGQPILQCDNMFLPQRVNVKDSLSLDGRENELEILFESAARVAEERERKHGAKFSKLRESSRMYVRKAQYQWGWDWGPSMITCGPYKDIRLEASSSKFLHLYAAADLSPDFKSASITVHADIASPSQQTELVFTLSGPGVNLEKTVNVTGSNTTALFRVDNPQIWWPAGHGSQPLYNVKARMNIKSQVLDTKTTTFGIRKVELIRNNLGGKEETFFFKINDKPIFCVGTNWIPCHSLPPCVTPDLYQKWIDVALLNNNNMIRIWGGGYYEDDAFYDYCDEKGVMLWHDMMFACGFYPTDKAFHQSVTQEIEAQVKRLRNHPSITLWNGDNEYFMMLDRQNIPYDPEQTSDFDVFPERILYFETIPNVLKRLHSEIPYWPSSPWGGNPANGPQSGDIHQWNVWHGLQLHYQFYPTLGGKFISEYGMHGFPDIRTVKNFAPDPNTRYPNSKVMDCHNKSAGADTKLGKYLSGNFRIDWYDMSAYVYLSQLMQCEALTYANRAWRREWKGPGRELCGGILIWQLNDIYPVTSWALVDSFFRRKPAFFTTKRDFAPVVVGVSRKPVWHFVDENSRHQHLTDIPTFEIYASSFLDEEREVELRVTMYDWATHQKVEVPEHQANTKHSLKVNASTELMTVKCPEAVTEESYVLLAVSLHDVQTGEEISRHLSWPEPYRYLLPARESTVETRVLEGGEKVELTCGKYPVKGLLAYVDDADGEEASWEDNMYDMMPGEKLVLGVKGLDGRKVRTRWLYSWEKHLSWR